MAGIFFLNAIQRPLRASRLEKKLALAATWPKAEAVIATSRTLPRDASFA